MPLRTPLDGVEEFKEKEIVKNQFKDRMRMTGRRGGGGGGEGEPPGCQAGRAA